MVTRPLDQLAGLALNFEGASAPEWVQLTPPGPQISGRDGRIWTLTDPEAVAQAYDPRKQPQIDIEHSSQIKSPKGEPAPAVGWIEEIAVRDGALWGRVAWTTDGALAVTSRAYRYLSPAFAYNAVTKDILRIVSAGLTNNPNLDMAALNRTSDQSSQETDTMDKAVLEALGLNADATAAQAVVAIEKLKGEKAVALNASQHPDPEKFVPNADYQLAMNRVAELDARDKARVEAEVVATVDAAVAAGKVAPSSKDYHLASCRAEGGLERFKAMIASAPVIAGSVDKPVDTNAAKVTEEELAVCRQLGITPEAFLKSKE